MIYICNIFCDDVIYQLKVKEAFSCLRGIFLFIFFGGRVILKKTVNNLDKQVKTLMFIAFYLYVAKCCLLFELQVLNDVKLRVLQGVSVGDCRHLVVKHANCSLASVSNLIYLIELFCFYFCYNQRYFFVLLPGAKHLLGASSHQREKHTVYIV